MFSLMATEIPVFETPTISGETASQREREAEESYADVDETEGDVDEVEKGVIGDRKDIMVMNVVFERGAVVCVDF